MKGHSRSAGRRTTDSWTNFNRYLVPVRELRHWASTLFQAISGEIARPRHTDRILPAAPRLQVEEKIGNKAGAL